MTHPQGSGTLAALSDLELDSIAIATMGMTLGPLGFAFAHRLMEILAALAGQGESASPKKIVVRVDRRAECFQDLTRVPEFHGDCFGATTQRREGDPKYNPSTVELFVEDDENWHSVVEFHTFWLPELRRILDEVAVALCSHGESASPIPIPHEEDIAEHFLLEVRRDAARWRRLVNASEMSFPVATIADDPENDCTLHYGRGRLEQFIDGLDEIPDSYAATPGDKNG